MKSEQEVGEKVESLRSQYINFFQKWVEAEKDSHAAEVYGNLCHVLEKIIEELKWVLS